MKALILAGGESRRFGQDKALVFSERLYQLLLPHFEEVWISCRASQSLASKFTWSSHLLMDASVQAEGPGAGFQAAFIQDSQSPWFIVACDMTGVDEDCVNFLKTAWAKTPAMAAVLFGEESSGAERPLYEPLLGIWSPGALRRFNQTPVPSPQKIAIEVQATLLTCPQPKWLINQNTPQ